MIMYKKQINKAILSFLVISALAFFCGCDNNNSHKDINAVHFSAKYDGWCLLTDSGDVYYNGRISEKDNSGVSNVSDSLFVSPSVKNDIYSVYTNSNAAKVHINSGGGTIVTDDNEVYIFVNAYPDNMLSSLKTPTLLCSGYIDAYLIANQTDNVKLILLDENGNLGWLTSDDPAQFHVLAHDIIKHKEASLPFPDIFALSSDNRLYIIPYDYTPDISLEYIAGIVDFDFVQNDSCGSILSYVDENHDAYVCMRDLKLQEQCSDFSRDKMEKVGESIVSVTSYQYGVAMLDVNHKLSLFGTDLQYVGLPDKIIRDDEIMFHGEVIMKNVASVEADCSYLFITKTDGTWQIFDPEHPISVEK